MKQVKFNAWIPKIEIMLKNVSVYDSGIIGISEKDLLNQLPDNLYVDYECECIYEIKEKGKSGDIPHSVVGILLGMDWFYFDEDQYVLLMSTGKHTLKGREVFEGDVLFEEIEDDEGDVRVYFIVVWIEETSSFGLLCDFEYIDYEDGRLEELDLQELSGLQSINKLHYAGNIFFNRNKIES